MDILKTLVKMHHTVFDQMANNLMEHKMLISLVFVCNNEDLGNCLFSTSIICFDMGVDVPHEARSF